MRAATVDTTARVLLLLGVLGLAAAGWLLLDNPDLDGTVRGDDYTCAAPYDTALNGEEPNVPGGEDEVGDIVDRCTEAGHGRFQLAVTAMAAGGVALVGAGRASR